MPLVFGKSLYLHTLFFTVISLKTYRIDMSKILIIDDEVQIRYSSDAYDGVGGV